MAVSPKEIPSRCASDCTIPGGRPGGNFPQALRLGYLRFLEMGNLLNALFV